MEQSRRILAFLSNVILEFSVYKLVKIEIDHINRYNKYRFFNWIREKLWYRLYY